MAESPSMPGRERFYLAIGTCFGLGLAPIAPGTAGALLGIPVFLGITLGTPYGWHTPLLLVSLLLASTINHLLTPWAISYWGCKDPKNFVLDEVAGYLMTVLLFRGGDNLLLTVLWTFFIFRLMDIIKLPPARQMESLPGSWGILLDDLMSAVYAAALLHGIHYWQPAWFGG